MTIALEELQSIATPIEQSPEPRRLAVLGRRSGAAVGWGVVGISVFVALWAIAASRVDQLPSPAATFDELRHQLSDPFRDNGPNDQGIGRQILSSLGRVFTGFSIAVVVGVPLGLLIGGSKRAWQAANPVIQVLRPVSPLAWFPIWLVVFKDSLQAATWVIFVTALWPMVVNTAAGAATVPKDQRNVARVFRFGRLTYARHVLIPNALPSVITGMRLSMGTAWMVIVAVEMMSSKAGIGMFVWNAYNAFDFAQVTAAVVLIGVVGFVLDLAFLRLGKAVALEEHHS